MHVWHAPQVRLLDGGVDKTRVALAQKINARMSLKDLAQVVAEKRIGEIQGAATVVADKENGAAAFAGAVVFNACAAGIQIKGIAIVINGAAAATARGAISRWIGAIADGRVVGKQAVQNVVGHADAAQCTAIRATIAQA